MTKYGKNYERNRRTFKQDAARRQLPCWICSGTLGPIDYTSRWIPGTKQPLLFHLDHAIPASLGGATADPKNFRPSHALCNVRRGNGTRGQFPTSRRW